MDVVNVQDYGQFSTEKMKKQNVFQSSRFFCDVYCFEPGQEQKGHVDANQDKVYLVLEGQGTFSVGVKPEYWEKGRQRWLPLVRSMAW